MAAAVILYIQICEMLLADGVCSVQTHNCTKFRQNRSFRCGDIAIFGFLRSPPPPSRIFETERYTHTHRHTHTNTPDWLSYQCTYILHCLWLARGNEILVGERALWRTDRMIFAILINSVTNAIHTSAVRWSCICIWISPWTLVSEN